MCDVVRATLELEARFKIQNNWSIILFGIFRRPYIKNINSNSNIKILIRIS